MVAVMPQHASASGRATLRWFEGVLRSEVGLRGLAGFGDVVLRLSASYFGLDLSGSDLEVPAVR